MKLTIAALAVLVAHAMPQDMVSPRDNSEAREPDRATVAVLRSDGVILPFAALKGSSWSVPWPQSLRDRELPVHVAGVPKAWWGGWEPDVWRAWLTNGKEVSLKLEAPAVFRIHCNSRLGIRTNHRALQPLPPVQANPFPKDGLAVAGGIHLEPIEIVSPASPERSTLVLSLLPDFDKAEELAIRAVRQGSGWRHPFNRAERRKLPVRLETWYRSPDGPSGSTISFIEAVRSYPARPEDDGCGLETFVTGWVRQTAGETRLIASISARVMYCDRVGANYMLPLGRVTVRGRVHWIYKSSGWASEWYAVTQITPQGTRIVAEYFAGSEESCRR
jgi:hypothetical protein